jgi:transcriptional regulator with GAF, ATPase, and Fis domain
LSKKVKSLASDLRDLAEVAARPDAIGPFLDRALETLQQTLASDLATFVEVRGDLLRVRRARGALATDELRGYRVSLAEAPGVREALDSRRAKVFDVASPDEEGSVIFSGTVRHEGGYSRLVVPVIAGDEDVGVLTFDGSGGRRYTPETIEIATIHGLLVGLGLSAARRAAQLEEYRDALEERTRILVEEIESETDACRALEASASKPMRRLVQMAKQVAITDAPVLVTGETGTGKEVLARAIHGWSARAERPFIELNCAALPESLIESELFGHRKGAFSGAVDDRRGRFRLADGGTLLLDEIGDLPPAVQVKLLRVLQEGTFEPVGVDSPVQVDVRVIAATNVNLEHAIDEGRFREDLYYRLHVFPLHLPPLRERLEDLPVLVEHVLSQLQRRTGRGPWTVDDNVMKKLARHDWPGNVRELVNTLERARIRVPGGGRLDVSLDSTRGKNSRRRGGRAWTTLAEHEREYVEQVLEHVDGRVYGEGGAAEILGLPPTTLQSRLRKLGIDKSRFRRD